MDTLLKALSKIKKDKLSKASDLEIARSKRIRKDIALGIEYSLVIKDGKIIAVRCEN